MTSTKKPILFTIVATIVVLAIAVFGLLMYSTTATNDMEIASAETYKETVEGMDVKAYDIDNQSVKYASFELTVDENGVLIACTNEKGFPLFLLECPETIGGKTVTGIKSELFKGNTYLYNLTLPSSVTSIGDSAFEGCTNLSYMDAPGLKSIGASAFSGCTYLGEYCWQLPDTVESIGASAFAGCSKLLDTDNNMGTVRNFITTKSGLKTIGAGAFANCPKLANLYLPSTLTSVGAGAFNGDTINVLYQSNHTDWKALNSGYDPNKKTDNVNIKCRYTLSFDANTTATYTGSLPTTPTECYFGDTIYLGSYSDIKRTDGFTQIGWSGNKDKHFNNRNYQHIICTDDIIGDSTSITLYACWGHDIDITLSIGELVKNSTPDTVKSATTAKASNPTLDCSLSVDTLYITNRNYNNPIYYSAITTAGEYFALIYIKAVDGLPFATSNSGYYGNGKRITINDTPINDDCYVGSMPIANLNIFDYSQNTGIGTYLCVPYQATAGIKVAFDGNKPTGVEGAVSNMPNPAYTYAFDGDPATLPTTITLTGYKWLGWSASKTATTASYTNSYTVAKASATNGVITLYAVWGQYDKNVTITSTVTIAKNVTKADLQGGINLGDSNLAIHELYILLSDGTTTTEETSFSKAGLYSVVVLIKVTDGSYFKASSEEEDIYCGTVSIFGMMAAMKKMYNTISTENNLPLLTRNPSNPNTYLGVRYDVCLDTAVYYDTNTTEDVTGLTKDTVYAFDEGVVTLPVAKTKTTEGVARTGYKLIGWAKSKTATTADYTTTYTADIDDAEDKNGIPTITLYAVWGQYDKAITITKTVTIAKNVTVADLSASLNLGDTELEVKDVYLAYAPGTDSQEILTSFSKAGRYALTIVIQAKDGSCFKCKEYYTYASNVTIFSETPYAAQGVTSCSVSGNQLESAAGNEYLMVICILVVDAQIKYYTKTGDTVTGLPTTDVYAFKADNVTLPVAKTNDTDGVFRTNYKLLGWAKTISATTPDFTTTYTVDAADIAIVSDVPTVSLYAIWGQYAEYVNVTISGYGKNKTADDLTVTVNDSNLLVDKVLIKDTDAGKYVTKMETAGNYQFTAILTHKNGLPFNYTKASQRVYTGEVYVNTKHMSSAYCGYEYSVEESSISIGHLDNGKNSIYLFTISYVTLVDLKVVYNKNTDDTITGLTASSIYAFDKDELTLPKQRVNSTSAGIFRADYKLLGWDTSSSATTPTYTTTYTPDKSTVNGDTVNLYAVWGRVNENINVTMTGLGKDATIETLKAGATLTNSNLKVEGVFIYYDYEDELVDKITNPGTYMIVFWIKTKDGSPFAFGGKDDDMVLYNKEATINSNATSVSYIGYEVYYAQIDHSPSECNDSLLVVASFIVDMYVSFDENCEDSVDGIESFIAFKDVEVAIPQQKVNGENDGAYRTADWRLLGWAKSKTATTPDYTTTFTPDLDDATWSDEICGMYITLYAVWETYTDDIALTYTSITKNSTPDTIKAASSIGDSKLEVADVYIFDPEAESIVDSIQNPGIYYISWVIKGKNGQTFTSEFNGMTQANEYVGDIKVNGNLIDPARAAYEYEIVSSNLRLSYDANQSTLYVTFYARVCVDAAIKYNANTTDSFYGIPSDDIYAYDEAVVNLPTRSINTGAVNNVFRSSEYTLVGWAKSKTATTPDYTTTYTVDLDDATVTSGIPTITLYAVWESYTKDIAITYSSITKNSTPDSIKAGASIGDSKLEITDVFIYSVNGDTMVDEIEDAGMYGIFWVIGGKNGESFKSTGIDVNRPNLHKYDGTVKINGYSANMVYAGYYYSSSSIYSSGSVTYSQYYNTTYLVAYYRIPIDVAIIFNKNTVDDVTNLPGLTFAYTNEELTFAEAYDEDSNPNGVKRGENEDYALIGWSLNENAIEPEVTTSYTVSLGNAEIVEGIPTITFYAIWNLRGYVELDIGSTTVTTTTYNGKAQEHVLKGPSKDLTGFVMYYRIGNTGEWLEEAINAGTYNVKVTRPADADYHKYEVEMPNALVINQVQVTNVSLKTTDFTYNGKDQSEDIVAVFKDVANKEVQLKLRFVTGYDEVGTEGFEDAGPYHLFFDVPDTHGTNYTIGNELYTTDVSIKHKEIKIDWVSRKLTYNGEEKVVTASYKNVYGEVVMLDVTVEGNFTDAGQYVATAKRSEEDTDHNYVLPTLVTKTYTIRKADPVIDTSLIEKNYTYTGEIQYVNSGAKIKDSEDVVEFVYTENELLNAGTYTVKISTPESDNYNEGKATVTVKVAKAEATIDTTGVAATYVYNGGEQKVTSGAVLNHNEAEAEYTSNTLRKVGTYTITITAPETANYLSTSTTVDVEVIKADATIDVSGVKKAYIYNGSKQYVRSGAVLSHDETNVTYSSNSFTNAGTYTVNVSAGATENYNATSGTVEVVVAKAEYNMTTVKFKNATVDYDGQVHGIVATNLPTGRDGIQITATYSEGLVEAGSKKIIATFATESTNYNAPKSMSAYITVRPTGNKSNLFPTSKSNDGPIIEVESDADLTNVQVEIKVEVVNAEKIDESTVLTVDYSNKIVGFGYQLSGVYDVKLYVNGEEKQPDDIAEGTILTVKMLLPDDVRGKDFKVLHVHNGNDIETIVKGDKADIGTYIIDEDGYIVTKVNKLSEFAFATKSECSIHWGLLVICGLFLAYAIVIWFVLKSRKYRKQGKLDWFVIGGMAVELVTFIVLACFANCSICIGAIILNIVTFLAIGGVYLYNTLYKKDEGDIKRDEERRIAKENGEPNEFEKFFGNIGNGIKTGWDKVVAFTNEKVVPPMKSAWDKVATFTKEKVVPPIKGAWDKVATFTKEKVVPPMKSAWDKVATFTKEKVVPPMKSAWDKVATFTKEKAVPAVKGAWDTVATFTKEKVVPPMKSAWDKVAGFVTGIFAKDKAEEVKPVQEPEVVAEPTGAIAEETSLAESMHKLQAIKSDGVVSKSALADFLEEQMEGKVIVNRRANYTKPAASRGKTEGLPLADTHYVITPDGKKVCYAYVYQDENGQVLILLRTSEQHAKALAEKHTGVAFSKFPKVNSGLKYYSLPIDGSYNDQQVFELLSEAAKVVCDNNYQAVVSDKDAWISESVTLADSMKKLQAIKSDGVVSKKAMADYLEEQFADNIIVNRRPNYTKPAASRGKTEGLPLADTHYVVAPDGKKICYTYIYENENGAVLILVRTSDAHAKALAEKHSGVAFSKFPKVRSGLKWYSLPIDDSYTDQQVFELLNEAAKVNCDNSYQPVVSDKDAWITESVTLAESMKKLETIKTKETINKKFVADHIEKGVEDVIVNRRPNYTKPAASRGKTEGLPLADTHYVIANDGKKVCYAYVYENENGSVLILIRTTDAHAKQLSEKHNGVAFSKFPKVRSGLKWYSLPIDDSYTDEDVRGILNTAKENNKK